MSAFDRQTEPLLDYRRRTLLLLLFCVLSVIGARLFYLQVVRNGYYNRLAFSNRIQRERIIAPRGLIRARDGSKLVVNVPAYRISIMPHMIGDMKDRLALACEWLSIDEGKLLENLADWEKRYPDGREMTVVQSAVKSQISVLRENSGLFPFFKLEMRPGRQYPEGPLAAHLLGYVREATDEELKSSGDLPPGTIVGRTGVERIYEKYLRGEDGIRLVEISAGGTRIGEIDGLLEDNGLESFVGSQPPVPGSDVYLTIDLDLQHAIEEIFDWERGSVIIMSPRTGEILAAVSRPVYDPNIFMEGISQEEWKELEENQAKPLFNRTVQATYPPGSVFKLITAYAALENRIVTRNSYLNPCLGAYKFGNRYFGCWKPEGHGQLNLYGAIVQSCDVYFYQLGEMLTADQFAEAGRLFGLDGTTGIDLPGEVKGILPDHAYFDRRFGKRKWTKGHFLNYSIGQGELLSTPMQICAMTAVFANGGMRVRPHVVKRIVDMNETLVYEDKGLAVPIPRIDGGTLQFIRQAMRGTISDKSGTGRASAIPGVETAGKTGTSQNPHGEDHALFVAFAPYDDPEIVLTIVMENAGHGGAMAAPMARRMLSAYFLTVAGTDSRPGHEVLAGTSH